MAGDIDDETALAAARDFGGLKGMDLAKEVTTEKTYQWSQHSWELGVGHSDQDPATTKYKVVAYDFGVKRNILRMLVDRGCELISSAGQNPGKRSVGHEPRRHIPIQRPW